jgi:hypothetical protein
MVPPKPSMMHMHAIKGERSVNVGEQHSPEDILKIMSVSVIYTKDLEKHTSTSRSE